MKTKELKGMFDDFEQSQYEKAKFHISQLEQKYMYLYKKESDIANLTYEKELIEFDIMRKIEDEISCSTANLFLGLMLNKVYNNAYEYFKEKKKEYKNDFIFLTSRIKHDILKNNDNFKLQDMTNLNYGTHYVFTYKYKSKLFDICIPNFQNVNTKNWKDLFDGYMIYKVENMVNTRIFYGLDYKKVSEDFNEYIKGLEK